MSKLGDGTTDAVSRVHDADQEPGYRKVEETRKADETDVNKFRSTLERRRRDGDSPTEGETNELVAKSQKSLLARIGDADPSDQPTARQTTDTPKDDASELKDALEEKDKLRDSDETGNDVAGDVDTAGQDLAAPDASPADVDTNAQEQTGSQATNPSDHQPQADAPPQQSQNNPAQSTQLAQMNNPQAHSGFDKTGDKHDHNPSESVHAAEQLRETSRKAHRGDPADVDGIAGAMGMTPAVQAAGHSSNEVSDAKEADRLRNEENNKLANKLLSDVSKILATFGDNKTQEVTVVLAPEVLPDTSFTVSLSNKGLEVKFKTKNSDVANKINDALEGLKDRLRGPNGLKVTVPKVSGGDDPDPEV